jgi:hypothetical protein
MNPRTNTCQLHLETLEDRLAPTALTVTPRATLPAAATAHVPSGLTIGAAASAAQATAHSGGAVVIG